MLLSGTLASVWELLVVLVIFVLILGLTWLTTRYIAGYQKGLNTKRNIEVIETYRITTGKYIQIVRTGGRYFAIGVGKDEIHMLTELSSDELKLSEEDATQMLSFKEFLNKAKHLKDNKKHEE